MCGGAQKLNWSYLTFNVNSAKGRNPRGFKQLASFAGQESDIFTSLFEKMLTVVINNELGCVGVGLKTELFGNET